MTALELRGDELYIGAAVPVNRIALDPLVSAHAQALVEACNLIAGPQVRNVATLGGNVAHALPAADGTIALLALEAQAEVASTHPGQRRVPFTSNFPRPGQICAQYMGKNLSLVLSSTFKNGQASCFKRIMRPQGVALPILICGLART